MSGTPTFARALALPILPFLLCLAAPAMSQPDRLVIAHRGASGYLPEHTLEAKVLAHAQGAHYIEQDVVLTRDGVLLVLHDLTLERTTDVAQRFPGRQREDGHWYALDFDLAELRTLRVGEPVLRAADGGPQPQFPGRFPTTQGNFRLHTLEEEIALIQGLNATLGREAGLYVELKAPWFHRREGVDLGRAVLEALRAAGYTGRNDPVYLQTFDFHALRRLREELMPALGMDLKLVQLIAPTAAAETWERAEDGSWRPYDYDWMHSQEGLRELARWADGIGPAHDMLLAAGTGTDAAGGDARETAGAAPGVPYRSTGLVARAHAAGLVVHPYTLRADPGRLPAYAATFEDWLRALFEDEGVDGVFTDFPDRALRWLELPRDPR